MASATVSASGEEAGMAYASAGLEYCIRCKDGGVVCVIPSNLTEKRLLKSSFYASHREEWLADTQAHKNNFPHSTACVRRVVGDVEVDIVLTRAEEETLQASLEKHGDAVESHGWYVRTVVW